MKLLFAAFVASSFILTGCKSEKLNYDAIEVHSHNDYVQANPFWGAFNAGTPSIEADVYLVDGDLYVAHRKKELIIDPEHTLRSMYLEPLKKEWDKNGGKPYADGGPLWLMVDMKRDQHASLSRLVEIIETEGYLPMFLGVHRRIRDFRPLDKARVVHLAKVKATFEQADDVLVNLSLGDEAALHCLGDTAVGIAIAALHVSSGDGSLG